jgi:hypothetical protein
MGADWFEPIVIYGFIIKHPHVSNKDHKEILKEMYRFSKQLDSEINFSNIKVHIAITSVHNRLESIYDPDMVERYGHVYIGINPNGDENILSIKQCLRTLWELCIKNGYLCESIDFHAVFELDFNVIEEFYNLTNDNLSDDN